MHFSNSHGQTLPLITPVINTVHLCFTLVKTTAKECWILDNENTKEIVVLKVK